MPPLTLDWVSPATIAARFNKSTRHIRRLCTSGALIDFGFKVAFIDGRWWIKLPPQSIN